MCLAGASAVVSLPYLVMGPNLLLDDWFTLWFRMRDGLFWTGGHQQLAARPGAFFVYLLQYGIIGAHPLVLYLLQASVNAATAALLFLAAAPLVGRRPAIAASVIWMLLANHSTTDRWFACLPSLLSLTLLLLGTVLLERATTRARFPTGALAAYVLSALCYEVSLLPAAIALLAVPWAMGSRPPLRRLVATEVPLVLTGLWMITHSQHVGGDFTGWFDFRAMVGAHLGAGLIRPTVVSGILLVAGGVGIFVALARRGFTLLRGVPPEATRLVLAGIAIILAGTAAFARYPIAPLGLGDRANAVASAGTALLWTGIGAIVWRARRAIAVTATAAFLGILAVGHVQRDVDYARAGDDSVRIMAALRARHAQDPTAALVVGPEPVFHHGITGLIGPLEQAVRADSGDPRRRARVAEDPSDFAQVPPALRVDTRRVLSSN